VIIDVYLEPRKPVWCCKCRPVSVKRNLKIVAKCGCFSMYCMLPHSRTLNSTSIFFTFYFTGRCCNTQNTHHYLRP